MPPFASGRLHQGAMPQVDLWGNEVKGRLSLLTAKEKKEEEKEQKEAAKEAAKAEKEAAKAEKKAAKAALEEQKKTEKEDNTGTKNRTTI